MKTILSTAHRGFLYRCTLDGTTITAITCIMEDSGVHMEMRFDELPEAVKDQLLNKIKQDNE